MNWRRRALLNYRSLAQVVVMVVLTCICFSTFRALHSCFARELQLAEQLRLPAFLNPTASATPPSAFEETIRSMGVGEGFFIVRTQTKPSFLLRLPNPAIDKTNGVRFLQVGVLHPHFTVLLRYLLKEKCEKDPGTVFLDSGCYWSYFSMYAAVMGCQVVCLEPNPHLTPLIRDSIKLNKVENKVRFFPKIVSDKNETLRHSLAGENWGNSVVQAGGEGPVISTIRIDDCVSSDVFIWKIDVEGYELKAIQSAKKLLETYRVSNIFIEWDKVRDKKGGDQAEDAAATLRYFHSTGYEVFGLPKEEYGEPVKDWSSDPIWLKGAVLIEPNSYSNTTEYDDIWIRKIVS